MRASIATVTLGGTIEQKLEAVAAAGFDAIEMFDADLDGARVAEIGSRAADLGLGVDLYQPLRDFEALAWSRHVDDYRRADRIVGLAGHPGLGLCLDSFHIVAGHDDLAAIRDIPGDRIFALQLADAPPRGARELIDWSRHHRCLPPEGSFDLATLLANVVATGYAGPWSLEIFSDRIQAMDPFEAAVAARRSLAGLMARHATTLAA